MAASGDLIEIAQFEKFSKLLDQLVVKLDKLDKTLGNVQSTSQKINFQIKGLDELERLLGLSQNFKLGSTGLKSFKNLVDIAHYLNDASLLLRKINPLAFQQLAQVATSIAEADSKLSGLVNLGKVTSGTLKQFLATIDGLVTISKHAAALNPTDFQKLPVVINMFGVVAARIQAFGSISGLTQGFLQSKIVQQLVAVLTGIQEIGKLSKKIDTAALNTLPMTLNTFSGALLALGNISSNVKKIASVAVYNVFISTLTGVIQGIQKIAALSAKVPVANFVNLSTSILQLQGVMNSVSKIAGPVALIGNLINGVFLKTILSVVQIVQEISKASGRTDITKINEFNAAVAALASIGKTVSISDLSKTFLVMRSISAILSSVVKSVIDQGIINEFIAVGLAFQRISTAFERIVTVVRGMNVNIFGHNAEMDKASKLLRQFTKIISDLVDSVFATQKRVLIFFTQDRGSSANADNLIALAKLLGALGGAYERIVVATKRLSLVNIGPEMAKALTIFRTLKSGIQMILSLIDDQRSLLQKVFGTGSKKPIDTAQLTALASLISALSSIIKRVFASLATFSGSKFDSTPETEKVIKQKTGFIKTLVDAFRGFSGKTLPDTLPALLGKIPKLLQTLTAIDAAGSGKSTGSKALDNAAQALSNFFKSISKIDPKKASALVDLGAAIRAFTSIKAVGDLSVLVRSVNQLILAVNATKIDRAAFRDLRVVSDEIANAFKSLSKIDVSTNQVGALQALVQAYSQLSHLKGNIPSIADTLLDLPATARAGKQTGVSFAKNIETGVFSAGIKLLVVRYFVDLASSIAKTFNPVAIFAAFKTGVQSVINFGRNILTVFDSVATRIRTIGQGIVNLGNQLETLGRGLIQNFGVQSLISGAAFTNAVNFDQLLSKVKTFGNLTMAQLQGIKDAAVRVGIDFPLSAAQGLEAGLNLIKAGLKASDAELTLPIVASLTQLSDSGDIDKISKGVIQIVNSFNQLSPTVASNFENVATVADILSSAADNSVASVESLMEGLANVGPAADQMGLDLQHTTAILALFAQGGIDGAEAGTQLKSLLKNFNSAPARAEFARLGVSIVDAQGNYRDLNDVINDLQEKFNSSTTQTFSPPGASPADLAALKIAKSAYASAARQILIYQNDLQGADIDEETRNKRLANYQRILVSAQAAIVRYTGSQSQADVVTRTISRTQEENVTSIQKLAGAYGQLGLSILLGNDENAINDFIAQMDKMPPAVERARQLLNNFAGDAEQLKGSLETLGINALQPLLESYFRPLIQVFRGVVDGLLKMDPIVVETGGVFIALASTLATVLGSSLILGGTLTKIGGGVISLLSSFLTFSNAGVSILGVLGGLVTGFVTLVAVVAPIALLFGGVSIALATMRKVIDENVGGAGDAFNFLRFTIKNAIDQLKVAIAQILDFVKVLFTGGEATSGFTLDDIGRSFGAVFGKIAGVFRVAAQDLFDFANALRGVTSIFRTGFKIDLTSLTALQNNAIIGWIFRRAGKSPIDQGALAGFVQSVRQAAFQLRDSFVVLGGAFKGFVHDLETGTPVDVAVGRLRSTLENGLSDLGASVLRLVGQIFNVDFSEAIHFLDQGKLSAGLKSLVNLVMGRIKTFFLNNRGTITKLLTSIFSNLFVPGGMLEKISGWLGLENLSGIIHTLRELLVGGFEGIVNTIFNLLSGQNLSTALTNAFGPGIQPVLDFVTELGNAVDNVIGLVGDLVAAVFTQGAGAGKPLGDVVTDALAGATDALGSLNKDVLEPLRKTVSSIDFTGVKNFFNDLFTSIGGFVTGVLSGDWAKASSGLGTALRSLFDVVVGVVASLFADTTKGGGKSQTFIQTLADGLVRAVQGAIDLVAGTLASFLHIDTAQFFTDISAAFAPLISAIESGDPAAVIGDLSGAILGAIKGLITLALTTVGSITGIDTSAVTTFIRTTLGSVITDIQNIFLGSDGSGTLLGNIGKTIDTFKDAIQRLLNVFSGTPLSAEAHQLLLDLPDALQKIGGITASAVTAPLTALSNFFSTLAGLNTNQMIALIGAVSGLAAVQVVGTFGGLAALLGSISALPTAAGLTLLNIKEGVQGLANTKIAKFAAALVIVDFLANLIKSLQFFSANHPESVLGVILSAIVGFARDLGLVDFGLSIADRIAALFGLQTQHNITQTLSQLRVVISVALAQIGDDITNFFLRLGDSISLAVNQAQLAVSDNRNKLFGNASLSSNSEALNAYFDDLKKSIGDRKIDVAAQLANLFTTGLDTAGSKVDPLIIERARLLARTNITDVLTAFDTEIAAVQGDPTKVQQIATNWFQVFAGLGNASQVENAMQKLFTGGNVPVVTSFLNGLGDSITSGANTAVFTDANVNKISTAFRDGIIAALRAGQIAPSDVTNLINLDSSALLLSNDDKAKIQTAVDAFKQTITDNLNTELANGTPTEVSVPVTATPTDVQVDTPAANDAFTQGIQRWAADNPDTFKLETPVDVTPTSATFDFSQVTTQGDVDSLTLSTDLATFAFQNLQDKVNTVAPTIVTQISIMSLVFTPFSNLLQNGLATIRNRFDEVIARQLGLTGVMTLTTPVLVLQTGAINLAFATMANSVVSNLDRVIGKLSDVQTSLNGVLGAIDAINNAKINNPLTGQQTGGGIPGRKAGGNVSPNQFYKVLEGNMPELFKSGKDFYFLSPQNGRVIPLTGASVPRVSRFAGQNNGGSIQVNYNPQTIIQIDGSNLDINQVAARVQASQEKANSQQRGDIERLIRNHGRSGF